MTMTQSEKYNDWFASRRRVNVGEYVLAEGRVDLTDCHEPEDEIVAFRCGGYVDVLSDGRFLVTVGRSSEVFDNISDAAAMLWNEYSIEYEMADYQ